MWNTTSRPNDAPINGTTRRAIYCRCSSPFWVDVAVNLAQQNAVTPCYWIARPDREQAVKEAFPGVVFHPTFDAVKGIPPATWSEVKLLPPDQTLLEALSPAALIALKMMDRMGPGDAFSYEERVRYYHRQLRYWLSVLEFFDPYLVVFQLTPHLMFDYVLYALCQQRGIKTVMFEHIKMGELVFPFDRYENRSQVFASVVQSQLRERRSMQAPLSAMAEACVDKLSGSYSTAMPFSWQKRLERHFGVRGRLSAWDRYPRHWLSMAKQAYHWLAAGAPPNYLKQKGRSVEESRTSGWQFLAYTWRANRTKRRLRSLYVALAQEVDLERPYIFVALHHQPEKSTSPEGGVFAHQFFMVDLLARCIPVGWHLYVKEHPSQLMSYSKGELSRSVDFYRDIASLPNVKLVRLSMPSFDLIDHAKAVATVTGTAGWEAVIRGVPVLVFGHAWYGGCEGVFYTPTQRDLNEALRRIETGYKVDREQVRLFTYALEQVCFRGYVRDVKAKEVGVTYEENVTSLTRAIQKFLP